MNLPIDTYYVWLQYHGNLATVSNYQLTLTIQ
jgi:hypothetical protein